MILKTMLTMIIMTKIIVYQLISPIPTLSLGMIYNNKNKGKEVYKFRIQIPVKKSYHLILMNKILNLIQKIHRPLNRIQALIQ